MGHVSPLLSKKGLLLQEKTFRVVGWDWMVRSGAGAAAILLLLCKGFQLPIIYQIEGELGHAVFKLFLKKISFFTVTVHLSSQMSLWLVMCGKEEKKEGEILLRDKEKCFVPSARARQRSMRRARMGLIAAPCFSASAIFLSKQKPHKYLGFYYCHDRGSVFCLK